MIRREIPSPPPLHCHSESVLFNGGPDRGIPGVRILTDRDGVRSDWRGSGNAFSPLLRRETPVPPAVTVSLVVGCVSGTRLVHGNLLCHHPDSSLLSNPFRKVGRSVESRGRGGPRG